ncbi:hypothetical protein [Janthinobacterium sp. TND4EL3]|uniref:hypothetical protein n=1 Tax=Janthinobacterium sp. TND4EL3 TaxID=1907311 RepID=UPI001115911F|nr:hypothetical protein [Janthinobacterium sp. TND4EL3]
MGPFNLRCVYLIVQVFGTTEPPQYWKDSKTINYVEDAYAKGNLDVDINLITFAIVARRMAHFIGQDQPMLNYVLTGLLDKAIPELFDQRFTVAMGKTGYRQGITVAFLDHLEGLAKQHLEEAGMALKDMDHMANMYRAVENRPLSGGGEVRTASRSQLSVRASPVCLRCLSVAEFFARNREANQKPSGAAQAVVRTTFLRLS